MRVPSEAVARKPTAFLRFMHDNPMMAAPGLYRVAGFGA